MQLIGLLRGNKVQMLVKTQTKLTYREINNKDFIGHHLGLSQPRLICTEWEQDCSLNPQGLYFLFFMSTISILCEKPLLLNMASAMDIICFDFFVRVEHVFSISGVNFMEIFAKQALTCSLLIFTQIE